MIATGYPFGGGHRRFRRFLPSGPPVGSGGSRDSPDGVPGGGRPAGLRRPSDVHRSERGRPSRGFRRRAFGPPAAGREWTSVGDSRIGGTGRTFPVRRRDGGTESSARARPEPGGPGRRGIVGRIDTTEGRYEKRHLRSRPASTESAAGSSRRPRGARVPRPGDTTHTHASLARDHAAVPPDPPPCVGRRAAWWLSGGRVIVGVISVASPIEGAPWTDRTPRVVRSDPDAAPIVHVRTEAVAVGRARGPPSPCASGGGFARQVTAPARGRRPSSSVGFRRGVPPVPSATAAHREAVAGPRSSGRHTGVASMRSPEGPFTRGPDVKPCLRRRNEFRRGASDERSRLRPAARGRHLPTRRRGYGGSRAPDAVAAVGVPERTAHQSMARRRRSGTRRSSVGTAAHAAAVAEDAGRRARGLYRSPRSGSRIARAPGLGLFTAVSGGAGATVSPRGAGGDGAGGWPRVDPAGRAVVSSLREARPHRRHRLRSHRRPPGPRRRHRRGGSSSRLRRPRAVARDEVPADGAGASDVVFRRRAAVRLVRCDPCVDRITPDRASVCTDSRIFDTGSGRVASRDPGARPRRYGPRTRSGAPPAGSGRTVARIGPPGRAPPSHSAIRRPGRADTAPHLLPPSMPGHPSGERIRSPAAAGEPPDRIPGAGAVLSAGSRVSGSGSIALRPARSGSGRGRSRPRDGRDGADGPGGSPVPGAGAARHRASRRSDRITRLPAPRPARGRVSPAGPRRADGSGSGPVPFPAGPSRPVRHRGPLSFPASCDPPLPSAEPRASPETGKAVRAGGARAGGDASSAEEIADVSREAGLQEEPTAAEDRPGRIPAAAEPAAAGRLVPGAAGAVAAAAGW